MKTTAAAILVLVAATGCLHHSPPTAKANSIPESVKRSDGEAKNSLAYSCLNSPFLSVAVSTRGHDAFVDVGLRLVDPLQRSAGYGNHERVIPQSSYGKVIEIPNYPDRSKAVAVEICDPVPGSYELTVWEHNGADYLVRVSGRDAKHNFTDILYPAAEEGRICHYSFDFRLGEAQETIYWLDERGRTLPMLEKPDCSSLQRASGDWNTALPPA